MGGIELGADHTAVPNPGNRGIGNGGDQSSAFVRHHAIQSLVAGLAAVLITVFTIGIGGIIFLVFFYWAYKAYQGENVEIPVLTKFVRQQGWIA